MDPLRILTLTDGDTLEVDMALVQPPSIMSPIMGGMAEQNFTPHAYDQVVATIESLTFLENWNMIIGEGLTNPLSDRIRDLFKILRRAWQFDNVPKFNRPIYLIQRAQCETDTRYALVRQCPTMRLPAPLFNLAFEAANLVDGMGITLERTIWRGGIPGVLPTKSTLTATDGPAGAATNIMHVVNYQDNHAINYILNWNGVAFSGNLLGTGPYDIFDATPANGDEFYIGSDEPFWDFIGEITTAGDPAGLTFVAEYSDGAAGWPALTLGDDYSLYPDTNPFNQLGQIAVNAQPGSDWATEAVNAVTRYWIRLRITALGGWATPAQLDNEYNQRTPEIRLPLALADGDVSPFLMMRLRHPAGGDENPEMPTTSRIVIGKKSIGLDSFISRIDLGNDGNPAGWTITADTDTAFASTPLAPGGDWAVTTYVTTTMQRRVTVQGVAKLADLKGEYRVFLRAQQTAGDPGDLSVRLIVKINEQTDFAPAVLFPQIDFKGTSVGELLDLTPNSVLKLPFADVFSADDLTNADIFFELWAERNAGAANLNWIDLILIPADEWIVDLNDPLSDIVTGNSALRGLTLLDVDSGIVDVRTIKQLIDGSDIFPAETWSRRSKPMNIEPQEIARLYFVMGHFTPGGDWGVPPFIGGQGMHLVVEMFKQDTFLYLRGDT